MRKSKIFGDKELALLEKHIVGSKKDDTGLWCRKIKPKVKELVDVWLPRRKELKRTIEVRKRGKR
jgi:hypothetical protein